MIELKKFMDDFAEKHEPNGIYGFFGNDQIETMIKDYTYNYLKLILKELKEYNRPRAGGQDGCVGVREAYGKNLIEIVEEYKRKLEE